MKHFLSSFAGNVIRCCTGRMVLWHLTAVVLTVILVTTGGDWLYFTATRNPILRSWMFPAAPIGAMVPIALPLVLLIGGSAGRNAALWRAGGAVGQAEIIGSLLSSAYKAITGRAHPSFGLGPDISHSFQFGFLRGGIFWGWPSSHTTIAFAMAVTLLKLFPQARCLGCFAVSYACYIGIGVSVTIHWLSDFAAGAIIGCVIGSVVGESFRRSPT